MFKNNKIATNPLSLSMPLIRENFKLYWYVPVLTLLAYFFSGIFPLFIRNSNEPNALYYLMQSMKLNMPAFWICMMGIPLITACLALTFIHKTKQAFAMHSQPYSKIRLFNSQILSGWLMFIIPIAIIAIMYLLFIPSANNWALDPSNSYIAKTFSMNAVTVLKWLFNSIAVFTYYYGLYILAGVLVGSTLMQVLLSGMFFCILPILNVIYNLYCSTFIIGIPAGGSMPNEKVLETNPIFKILFSTRNAEISYWPYLIAGILMIVLSLFIYRIIKLEKVGDSMLFKVTEEIITVLLVFVGMSIFGAFLYSLNESREVWILGSIIGIFITIFIVKIVFNRSIKIFNKENLKSLILCLVLAIIFFCFTVLDIAKIGIKIPNVTNVKEVYTTSMVESLNRGILPYTNTGSTATIKDQATLEKVIDLHRYVIENNLYKYDNDGIPSRFVGDTIDDESMKYVDLVETLRFHYELKNGTSFIREFHVKMTDELANKISDLVNEPKFKDSNKFTSDVKNQIKSIYTTIETTGLKQIGFKPKADDESYAFGLSNGDDIKKLLKAYEKDIDNFDYLKYVNLTKENKYNFKYLGHINLFRGNKDSPLYLTIMDAHKNTMKCIKDNFTDYIKAESQILG